MFNRNGPARGRRSRLRRARSLVWLPAFLALLSCSVHELDRKLIDARSLDELPTQAHSETLKAHLREGGVLVLRSWSVDQTTATVRGVGQHLGPDRAVLRNGALSVAIDSVAIFETNATKTAPSVGLMTGMTIVSGMVTVACLANPKACFGSCPTFYVESPPGSGQWELVAEGFSSSIAPSLEATDIDALWPARDGADGRRFRLRVTNEAYETHAIRHADLLAIPVPGGMRAGVDAQARFHLLEEMLDPVSAQGDEGDVRAPLLAADGIEWSTLASETDLATKETITLRFDVPETPRVNHSSAESSYGVVLHLRQTLMSTWLFYQALAYLGTEAGHWLAELERGGAESRERTFALGRALGGIEVQRRDAASTDGWRTVHTLHETGPLARDVDVVPIGMLAPGPVELRLRLTKGLWRLDRVALARLGPTANAERLRPAQVLRLNDGELEDDPEARDALLDPERTLVTLPGDELHLIYELDQGDFANYELLLESRGWYLEWMREEWLAEENPLAAAHMLLAPEQALRSLAAAYKQDEPEMENLFWGSRYARP